MWFGYLVLILLLIYGGHGEDAGNGDCLTGQFSCGDGICIQESWRCDGEKDCVTDLDEQNCANHESCKAGEFNCGNNSLCIPISWKCDNTSDCPYGEDERPDVCNKKTQCEPSKFNCGDGTCIPNLWVCDDMADCMNGTDEQCAETTCSEDEFRCESNGKCVPKDWRCDGDGDCSDKSDEKNCEKKTSNCAQDQFECGNGVCLFNTWRCDGSKDCEDNSDELKCTELEKKNSIGCSDQDFACADGEQCIHSSWRCDGDGDCLDDSDEKNCTHTCKSGDFLCDNNECISSSLRCDGEVDCLDATDEQNCSTTTVAPTCSPDTLRCRISDTWQCLDGSKVCDGVKDCNNYEDETNCPSSNDDPCKVNNGECLQVCVKEFGNKHRCECHPGFRKMGNNSCEDINECESEERMCSQHCINTKGSYHCSCVNGYILERKTYCRVAGKRPELLIANRYDIRTLQLDSWIQNTWLDELSSTVSVDYDYNDEYVFWSDVSLETINRVRRSHNGTILEDNKKIITTNVKTPDGIAVDWVYNHLYWTDAGNDRIEVSDYNGKLRKTLITSGLDEPRAIVVDPIRGWMYWSDWGTKPKITRCGMNGERYEEIITDNLQWPNGLTLDFVDQKLFWIDAKLNKIMTADVDGKNHRTVLHNAQYIQHPFAIAVFEDKLYWSDWNAESIRTINKFRGDGFQQVALGLHSPMDVHVYHENVQYNGTNHCGSNNGGCSQFCLPAPVSGPKFDMQKFTCACVDGYILYSDGKTCLSEKTTAPVTTVPATSTVYANASTTTYHPNRVTNEKTTAPVTTVPATSTVYANASTTTYHPNRVTNATSTPITSQAPSVTTETPKPTVVEITTGHEGGYTVVTAEPTVNKTTTVVTVTRPSHQIGLIAGIVSAVLFIIFLIVGISAYVVYLRYKKRNVKSMNFDNPVYKKTTEDHFVNLYGREPSQSKRESNPALVPLTGNLAPEVC